MGPRLVLKRRDISGNSVHISKARAHSVGQIKDDELIATEVELCVGNREECSCPRKGYSSCPCCWGGPGSLEGNGVYAEFRQGGQLLDYFPKPCIFRSFFLHFLTPAVFLGRCFTA